MFFARKKIKPAALAAMALSVTATGFMHSLTALAQDGAVVLEEFSAWALHQSKSDKHNICYVASEPQSKAPKGASRGAIVFYVSSWPSDGVKSEVSVKLGYPLEKSTKVSVAIGEDTFELTPNNERAYLYNSTEELKLIEAMKKGNQMIVTGVSARGTKTTDTYSLSGITAALKAMAEKCS